MNILESSALLFLATCLLACSHDSAQRVSTENRKTREGNLYTVFYPDGLAIQVVDKRPNPKAEQYHLSVAAAYTDLQNDQPLDLMIFRGKVLQTTSKVGFLDGILTIVGDTLTIRKIPKGQSPPRAQLQRVSSQKGTLLLQELLVFEGENQRPEGGSVFQRRALVEFANHQFAVIESESDYIKMKQFGDDLVELGARNALYLDMGDWDEGWYKTNNAVVMLGNRRSETARQSNWLVFVEPSASPTHE